MSQNDNKATNYKFTTDTLCMVLSKKLNEEVTEATFEQKQLQGGTVADVRLIKGIATTSTEEIPYQVVLKVQNKWERFADQHSWRREYDLYASNLGEMFDESFHWPTCFHTEQSENQTLIWMDYAEGITGHELTIEMYAKAAEALGRFQGKLYKENPDSLASILNLSDLDYAKTKYERMSSWPEGTEYVRKEDSDLPKHICKMITDIDDNRVEVWKKIESQPIIFSHRDYWFTNIFYSKDNITAIDWDTTGWGHLGEDLASLIADEVNPEIMLDLYNTCVPAYYNGFSTYADSNIEDNCVYELILIMFGYSMVGDYIYAKTEEEKKSCLQRLEAVYQMKNK